MLSFVELRSPCRAIVHEIAPFPEGSAVGEAEALITLVPIDGNIEVEARVEPRDIGRIAPGSDVRIKLSAWSFQKHGTINGKVLHISEDTISRGGAAGGIDPATGEPRSMTYYRARISIEGTDTLRNLPKNFRLVPGMEVEAEIKTGRRRIIEYITYPLIKALDETAREP
jgi:HlyD family secretion protein